MKREDSGKISESVVEEELRLGMKGKNFGKITTIVVQGGIEIDNDCR